MATADDTKKEELTADIIQEPGYDISSRKKVKLTEEILIILKNHLLRRWQWLNKGFTIKISR